MKLKKTYLAATLFAFTLGMAGLLHAQSPVSITVDTQHPGKTIPSDFSGLSFETSQLLPNSNGVRYFRPENQHLIALFNTLGIKSLRIGGNTSDRNVQILPDEADLDSLFGFAKASGVKVIYCLRLHDGNPNQDADVAKYIMTHYSDEISCFSIGQEPNVYPKVPVTNTVAGQTHVSPGKFPYTLYAKEWEKFEKAIIDEAPDAEFCGPSVDANPSWPEQFMADFGRGYHVALITAHFYPGRSGDKVPTPEIGRDQMLSAGFISAYQKFYDGFAADALARGLPYRLEEVNNYFNGGAADVSNTFASALWGLDFMYWWAEHGAAGLNFHTGDKVAAGASLRPSKYTAYYTIENGFLVRPLGYGMKAFDLGRHGRIIPVTISNPQNLNMSVYAVLGDDKSIFVTVINKEHGIQAKGAAITVAAGLSLNEAKIISLTAPNGDIAATTGTTLGGVEIKNDGSWSGNWTELKQVKAGMFTFEVSPSSAVVVKMTGT